MKHIYDDITSLAKTLIGFQSIYEQPEQLQKVIDFCVAFFDDDFVVKEFNQNNKPSLVVSTHDTQHFDVLLNGHVDVVQAAASDFTPVEKDGKIYGRGALDMKGPVAVLMSVMKQIQEINSSISVGLMLTTDEEVGGHDGVGYLVDEVGYTADVVLVPDGGAMDRIVIAQKGVLHCRLIARGRSAHSSRPWLGKNAIDSMMACYNDLQQAFPSPSEEVDWRTSINLSTISAGEAMNMVPDECVAGLNIRYTEEKNSDEWLREVCDICSRYDVEVEVEMSAPLCFTDEKNIYVQKFKNATEETLGREVQFGVETGASDARYFSNQGMPVIINNPVGDNIHTQGEYVEITSLHRCYDIFASFLRSINLVEKSE